MILVGDPECCSRVELWHGIQRNNVGLPSQSSLQFGVPWKLHWGLAICEGIGYSVGAMPYTRTRPITPTDTSSVLRLVNQQISKATGDAGTPMQYSELADLLKQPGTFGVVAIEGNYRVLGALVITEPSYGRGTTGPQITILAAEDMIAISSLFEEAFAEARRRGIQQLSIRVAPGDKTLQRWCERHATGTTKTAFFVEYEFSLIQQRSLRPTAPTLE